MTKKELDKYIYDKINKLRDCRFKICADCRLFKDEVDMSCYCEKIKSWVCGWDIVETDKCFEKKDI